jgi:NAD(P)H-nitrite reductase large subunit
VSEPRRYVVIGNGIAGTTAAETLRKNDPNCHISLFAEEPYPLYNRVALPPALKLEKPMPKVFLKTVEFHAERNICFYPSTRVTSVDLVGKVVVTDRGTEAPFDSLLVATGGVPNPLPAQGADAHGVCYFQTFDDTADLLNRISRSQKAVTVGGSYIAYELAEAFVSRGLDVTWLVRGPHVMHRMLDEDGGAVVDAIGRRKGVDFVYRDSAESVEARDGAVAAVVTTGGRRIETDFIGCGLGLHLNHDFLPKPQIETAYGIVTNEFLQSSAEDVYAAGDVAEFLDTELNLHHSMGTWASATLHGRIAALNMAGARQAVVDLPNYTSTLFDSRMTVFGSTTEIEPNLNAVSRTTSPTDGNDWAYRRLFFREDRLVGAVLIGDMHARIDLIKMIKARESAWDRREELLSL